MQPTLLVTDLEGVLVPEIWIAVAEETGIDELRLTTRDIPDYDQLMNHRMEILRAHHLTLDNIRTVIATLEPLPGAKAYFDRVRAQHPCVILSDTFYEFAAPLMAKLDQPTLFCHTLDVDQDGMIVGYQLRMPDSKRAAVLSLQQLGFRVLAVGDSYNDLSMLTTADAGFLFRAPPQVIEAAPQLPVCYEYDELERALGGN
jgi:phosphoserine/homoserine phosphotransferase